MTHGLARISCEQKQRTSQGSCPFQMELEYVENDVGSVRLSLFLERRHIQSQLAIGHTLSVSAAHRGPPKHVCSRMQSYRQMRLK